MTLSRFLCEVCGVATLTEVYRDCQVVIDKDDFGAMHVLTVCPEHRAKFLRLISEFVEGKA